MRISPMVTEMVCTRMFGKKESKGHNLEIKKGGVIILVRDMFSSPNILVIALKRNSGACRPGALNSRPLALKSEIFAPLCAQLCPLC